MNPGPPWPVLLLVRELGQGGSQRQLAVMARSLDRAYFTPHVGCLLPEGIRNSELKAAAVPILHLPVHSFQSMSALRGAVQLGRYIRRQGIKLVHAFDVPMNVFGIPAARVLSGAVVLASVRAHPDLAPRRFRRLLRRTNRMADAVVVNCEYLRRHLIDEQGIRPEKVLLCHNGIDMEEFSPASRERPPEFADADLVIGAVCEMRPEKGLTTLLDAFEAVARLHPKLQLVLVGSGPYEAELQARTAHHNLSDRVLFLPQRSGVATLLRGIDIFVLPSLSEALSNALLEAMACGCAAVASRVGGNPEVVEHEKTGLLFEKSNVPDLASALRRLVEDQALRARLSAAAVAVVREKFSLAGSAERMKEIYLGSLAKKSG